MNFDKITSAANSKIKEILKIKNKRSIYKADAFIIEGTNLIETALNSGNTIKQVFFTDSFRARKEGRKILKEIAEKTGEIFNVTDQIISKLADTETPQGIIATASYKTRRLDDIKFKSNPLIAVIDRVQDPGNLGTIIRTADAAGADAVVVLKGTCDPFMQKTLRASAGSIFNIPVVSAQSVEFIKWLKIQGISLIATDADGDVSVFDADLKKPTAFVFGNEAHGISWEIREMAEIIVKVPVQGKAESLNVASSSAICLYEAVRQRRQT